MEFWYALIAVALSFLLVSAWRRDRVKKRRDRVRSQPFPSHWDAFLNRNVALYRALPTDLRKTLWELILLFLDEKQFEGCNGLDITEEVRITVASQACLLLLNRPDYPVYPGLISILVYPDVYLAPEYLPLDDNLYVETTGVQSGESWQEGLVVLAWKDVRAESRSLGQGYNVVLHEFAHQLDQENGWADGTPLLRDPGQYRAWHSIFHREFEKIRQDSEGHLLDEYGALDPAEFFAVATETFFQLPQEMYTGTPDLYGALKDYYGVDPVRWPDQSKQ